MWFGLLSKDPTKFPIFLYPASHDSVLMPSPLSETVANSGVAGVHTKEGMPVSDPFAPDLKRLAKEYTPRKGPARSTGRVVADPKGVKAILASAIGNLFGNELWEALKAEGARGDPPQTQSKPRPAKSGARRKSTQTKARSGKHVKQAAKSKRSRRQ